VENMTQQLQAAEAQAVRGRNDQLQKELLELRNKLDAKVRATWLGRELPAGSRVGSYNRACRSPGSPSPCTSQE
jgi:hypothetical protein